MDTFTLTEKHIELLSNAYVDWNDIEFGAPAIDPKRPYGNSNVLDDIIEIFNIPALKCPRCNEIMSNTEEGLLEKIHKETQVALQIILCTKSFEPGEYTRVGVHVNKWKKVIR